VTKTASSTAVQAGDNLTYTVMVDNNGPSLASNVQVTDALPAGVTFVSGTGPNGETLSATNGIVTVDGGDVANGGSFSFTITVQADAGTSGDITNSASVTSDTNETITTNNAATATVSVDPRTSSIRGTVFEDDDNDGVQDAGEEAIPGVEINLSGIDALGNAVNRSTTTDASGNYAFEELAAGTYTVTQTQPAGFRDGIESVGTGAPATAGDNVFSELVLGVGTDAAAFNFAELGEPLSKRRFLASTT